MKTRYPLSGGCLLLLCLIAFAPSHAQTYRNVVNQRFNTVANGPMQAIIVDVPNLDDTLAVHRAVAAKVNAVRQARESVLMREVQILKQHGYFKKRDPNPGFADIVVLRQNGRLVLPQPRTSRAGNELTLTFPAPGAPGSWPAAQQTEYQNVWDTVYGTLRNNVWGAPSWNGAVKLVNGDNLTPIISDRNSLAGGVFNASTNEIIDSVHPSAQTRVLNLTQMMALAFRGPDAISYDVWERGMARAATLITVRSVLTLLEPRLFPTGTIDIADPLYHALDRYELLNQPALGNDRFFPVSQVNDPVNTASLAGMLYPRLQMSGSAWLKVAEENPSALRQFNAAYYLALLSNPGLKNSVPGLKALMAGIVPTVEGIAFTDWYQQQYILDTSVTPGEKLYAWSFADRPDTAAKDDFAIGIVLVYYRTQFDANNNSNEANLNGTCYPIYWDYTFGFRLFLTAQFERADIRNGITSPSLDPTFFGNIGGDPAQEGRMRVTIDLPVNSNSVRLYTAPRSMGSAAAPNNFWGTVVGADTGTMRIDVENGVSKEFDVKQGAFGGVIDASAFAQPRRATLTFTNTANQKTIRKVNLGYNEYVSVFYATDSVQSVTSTLPAGPAMISFPILPLHGKAEEALLNPANNAPLFNSTNLLLAEWRQSVNSDDKYLKYPFMDPLQPGHGYWSDLSGATPVKIAGRVLNNDADVSTGLLHGWNQIGNPYQQTIDITDLQFQYLADNVPQNLANAILKGWIVAQDVAGVGQVAIFDYVPSSGYVKATQLVPWRGYWIRALVSEGVTITFPNPSRAARSVRMTRAAPVSKTTGWSIPLRIAGPNGYASTAYLGMSDQASSGYDNKFDALLPPAFSRAVPSIAFSHPDWGDNAGDYYSDIRPSTSRQAWQLSVYTPAPNTNYTLSWANLTGVPRSTRLILLDTATGRRQYMQSSSGFSFNSGTTPTRNFQVIPELRGRTALRISNVIPRQSRAVGGRSVEIGFDLSSGAEVATEIRGADGRVLRRLGPGRATAAGTNQVLWDTRDDRGVTVASGAYIVKITAKTPEGETTTVIQPVLLVR